MEGKKKRHFKNKQDWGEKISANTKILKDYFQKAWGSDYIKVGYLFCLRKKKISLSPKYLTDLACEYIQHKKYIWFESHIISKGNDFFKKSTSSVMLAYFSFFSCGSFLFNIFNQFVIFMGTEIPTDVFLTRADITLVDTYTMSFVHLFIPWIIYLILAAIRNRKNNIGWKVSS